MQALPPCEPSTSAELVSRDVQISSPRIDDAFSHPTSLNVSTKLAARSDGKDSQQQRKSEWVEVRVITCIDSAREELVYEYVVIDRRSLSVTA
jgi:hypothetical protein